MLGVFVPNSWRGCHRWHVLTLASWGQFFPEADTTAQGKDVCLWVPTQCRNVVRLAEMSLLYLLYNWWWLNWNAHRLATFFIGINLLLIWSHSKSFIEVPLSVSRFPSYLYLFVSLSLLLSHACVRVRAQTHTHTHTITTISQPPPSSLSYSLSSFSYTHSNNLVDRGRLGDQTK